MLFMAVSLYCEAKPFIKYMKLVKDREFRCFDLFANEGVCLVITGTGALNCAIGVTKLCDYKKAAGEDVFANIGICGGHTAGIGQVYLGNKIIDQASGRMYYPDIYYKHNFEETTINTLAKPVQSIKEFEGVVDMEAAAGFYAGSFHFDKGRMFFIKIVSDNGDTALVTPDTVSKLISREAENIGGWLLSVEGDKKQNSPLSESETAVFNQVKTNMGIGATMAHKLRQSLVYAKINGTDILLILNRYKHIEIKEKTEGKKCLAQLFAELTV